METKTAKQSINVRFIIGKGVESLFDWTVKSKDWWIIDEGFIHQIMCQFRASRIIGQTTCCSCCPWRTRWCQPRHRTPSVEKCASYYYRAGSWDSRRTPPTAPYAPPCVPNSIRTGHKTARRCYRCSICPRLPSGACKGWSASLGPCYPELCFRKIPKSHQIGPKTRSLQTTATASA